MWETILVLPSGKIAERYLHHSEGKAWAAAYHFNYAHLGHGPVMLHRKVKREEAERHDS